MVQRMSALQIAERSSPFRQFPNLVRIREGQLARERGLQVRLQKLAVPPITHHEVHVNPMASLVGVPVAHVSQYRQTKGEHVYGINRYSTAVAKLLGWRLLAFSR
jgi:hypothetical protein